MAQELSGVRMIFFQNCEKLWLTNGKIEGLEICAAKQLH